MNPRQPRRLPWALIASVLLHALLLAFVLWRTSEERPNPAGPKPLEVDLVMVPPAAAVAPATAQKAEPPTARPQPPKAHKPARKPASTSPSEVAKVAPVAPSGVAAASSEPADSPRQGDSNSFLVPRVGTMLPGLGKGGDENEASGHTRRNGPGEEPDQAAVREYTAERAKERLDNQLGEMVADAQRKNGLVDPYFTRLQAELVAGFQGSKVQLSSRTTQEAFQQEVVGSYVDPAQRFAKTGNPMADPEQARQFNESSFGRLLERGGSQLGDSHDQRMLEAGMQSMAFTQIMKDSVSRPRLKTVLMLRQDGNGALAETTVIERSGDKEFDEYVLHLTRKVVLVQGDTSESGGAPSALGWSSVWQFTWEPPQVKVKLLRVLRAKPSVLDSAQ
jgi:hypothetical protein